MLEYLAAAGVSHKGDVGKDEAQVVVEKFRKRKRGAHAHNVYLVCVHDSVNGFFKLVLVRQRNGRGNTLRVRREHLFEDVVLRVSVVCDLKTLHACQPLSQRFLHGAVQLGVSLKAKLYGKADNGGFGHTGLLAKSGCRQISRLFAMLRYIRSDALLPL